MFADLAPFLPHILTAVISLGAVVLHQQFNGNFPIISWIMNLIGINAGNSTTPASSATTTPTIGQVIDTLVSAVSSKGGVLAGIATLLSSSTVRGKIASFLQSLLGAATTTASSTTPTAPPTATK